MEIVSSDAGILSNIEVASLISELHTTRAPKDGNKSKISSSLRDREVVERKVLHYAKTICGPYTLVQTEACLAALQAPDGPWTMLEEEEKLQIINLVPRSECEFMMCMCNRDLQLEPEEVEKILAVVAQCFGIDQ